MAAETKPVPYTRAGIAGEYGISKAILEENPDLQAVLDTIFADLKRGVEYQPKDIATMIRNTDWFKKHTNSWMNIQKDRASKDPKIWDALVSQRAEEIIQTATQAGAQIDEPTARKYAEQMMYGSGWNGDSFEIYNETWLKKALSSAIDYTKTKTVNGVEMYDLTGTAEDNASKLYDLAYQYGVDSSMSNTAFTSWFQKSLKGIMDGTVAQQDIDDEIQQMALSRFPGMASQFQRGLSLRQAADPYLKTIADTLDMPIDGVSLDDDLVQRVLNNVDEQGNFKPMSLYDAKLAARKDPRWKYTEKAKNEYTDAASQILKDFGFLG